MDNLYLIAFAQNILANIPINTIITYSNKFNKNTLSSLSPIQDLIKNICIFLNKKDKKQWTNDKIKKYLIEYTQQLGEQLKNSMNLLMENKYLNVLKKNIPIIAEMDGQKINNDKKITDKKVSGKNKTNNNYVNNKNHGQNTEKTHKKIKNIEQNKQPNLIIQNLCQSQQVIEQSQANGVNSTFFCQLCKKYHQNYGIQVLNAETKVCIYCHIKNLNPLNNIIQSIFQGILKKQQKTSQIIFDINPSFLKQSKYLIQMRSLRLKHSATSSILFPDHTIITLNNQFSKEYIPLIKQSSLKYRKDESFYLNKENCKQKNNKLVIQTKLFNIVEKDQRIQPQDHLIGIYIIQEKSINNKFQCIKENCLNNYQESIRLLNKSLQGNIQDIFVELIKIPLNCIFTGEQIKIPARGIFCQHFQCFDLYNYLIFIGKSQHPRWLCPFCKSPTYIFKIDCLLLAIIKEKIQSSATEILFFPNNTYTILNKQSIIGIQNNKISDLNIETICKRQLTKIPQGNGTKRKKKGDFIIDKQKLICLQQD